MLTLLASTVEGARLLPTDLLHNRLDILRFITSDVLNVH